MIPPNGVCAAYPLKAISGHIIGVVIGTGKGAGRLETDGIALDHFQDRKSRQIDDKIFLPGHGQSSFLVRDRTR